MEVLQGVDLGMAWRYYSLKLFERDPLVQQVLALEDALAKEIEMIIKITEDVLGRMLNLLLLMSAMHILNKFVTWLRLKLMIWNGDVQTKLIALSPIDF